MTEYQEQTNPATNLTTHFKVAPKTVLFSCLALHSSANTFPKSVLFGLSRTTAAFATDPIEPCKANEPPSWKCQDCSTIQFCNGAATAEYALKCAAQNPNKPYCKNGVDITTVVDKCVSDANVCSGGPNNFVCPEEGIWPSLTDCKTYYSCTNSNSKLEATQYMCLYGTVYNHSTKFCKSGSPCYVATIDCGDQSKMIPYKQNPNLYVVCLTGKAPLLKACPENFVYNSSLFQCEFQCPGEGIFADSQVGTKFIRCFSDGKTLQKDLAECPTGLVFDKIKKYCVTKSSSPGEAQKQP